MSLSILGHLRSDRRSERLSLRFTLITVQYGAVPGKFESMFLTTMKQPFVRANNIAASRLTTAVFIFQFFTRHFHMFTVFRNNKQYTSFEIIASVTRGAFRKETDFPRKKPRNHNAFKCIY